MQVMPWARVVVDGASWGATPLPSRALLAGSHRVQLYGPNGELVYDHKVSIKPHQQQRIEVNLNHR